MVNPQGTELYRNHRRREDILASDGAGDIFCSATHYAIRVPVAAALRLVSHSKD